MKKIFIGVLTSCVVAAVTATAVVTSVSAQSDQQIKLKTEQIQEQRVDGYRFILKDGVVYTIYETDRSSMQRIFSGDIDEFNKLYKATFKFLSKNKELSGLKYLSFISTTSKDMKFGTASSKEPSQLIFMNLKSNINDWRQIGNWFAARKPEIYNGDFEFFENTSGNSRTQWWADKATASNIIPTTGLTISDETAFAISSLPDGATLDWKKYLPQLSKITLPKDISFKVIVGSGTTYGTQGFKYNLKIVFTSSEEVIEKAIKPVHKYNMDNFLFNSKMQSVMHYDSIYPSPSMESQFENKISVNIPMPNNIKVGDDVKFEDIFKGQQEIISHLNGKTFKEWITDNLGSSSSVDEAKILVKNKTDNSMKIEFTLKLKDKVDPTKVTIASLLYEVYYKIRRKNEI